jgi:hypothetical protein
LKFEPSVGGESNFAHLNVNHLNSLNIIFLLNGFFNESFVLQPFFFNFKILKVLYDLIFYQVHPLIETLLFAVRLCLQL